MIFGIRTIQYATRAFARKMWRMLRGKSMFVSNEEQRKRIVKCHCCEFYKKGQCVICTCFVETKTMFVDEYCPDNPPKW